MRDLDEVDLEILRLLAEDGRRPYREIADRVDLSPPAVSDRVDRLQEYGVIRQFTVDVDHSKLHEGTIVLVDLDVRPEHVDAVRETLVECRDVDHVFATANARVVFHATVLADDVREWLLDRLDVDAIDDYTVELLTDVDWNRRIDGAGFSISCVECGNTVTDEGEIVRVDGDRKHFCCSSCRDRYTERYAELQDGTEG